jgi:hypothetical protein
VNKFQFAEVQRIDRQLPAILAQSGILISPCRVMPNQPGRIVMEYTATSSREIHKHYLETVLRRDFLATQVVFYAVDGFVPQYFVCFRLDQ